MSASSQPISLQRFKDALPSLPLSSLYDTVLTTTNSLSHLVSSNQQLEPLAREGDEVCQEAYQENGEVMARMKDRLSALQQEFDQRGVSWVLDDNHFNGVKPVTDPS